MKGILRSAVYILVLYCTGINKLSRQLPGNLTLTPNTEPVHTVRIFSDGHKFVKSIIMIVTTTFNYLLVMKQRPDFSNVRNDTSATIF
jgi:hypothetical protein